MSRDRSKLRKVASIDVGSNSAILLVAERSKTGWKSILDRVEVTRIAEGLDASGLLAAVPVERTSQVINAYIETARELEVEEIFVTGTAPFRRARNGRAVSQQLAAKHQVVFAVVSGEREAELSMLATRGSFPQLQPLVLADIGGASTEIVVSGAGLETMVSMDVGSVRLTERHVTTDPIAASERSALSGTIDAALDACGAAEHSGRSEVLAGIAGTVTSVATIHLGLEAYDADRVHGLELSLEEVSDVVERLFALTLEERKALPGCPPARADVLPAGALLLLRIMERLGSRRLLVSDRGVRWGRIYAECGAS